MNGQDNLPAGSNTPQEGAWIYSEAILSIFAVNCWYIFGLTEPDNKEITHRNP
jgi:hypothetical protein